MLIIAILNWGANKTYGKAPKESICLYVWLSAATKAIVEKWFAFMSTQMAYCSDPTIVEETSYIPKCIASEIARVFFFELKN